MPGSLGGKAGSRTTNAKGYQEEIPSREGRKKNHLVIHCSVTLECIRLNQWAGVERNALFGQNGQQRRFSPLIRCAANDAHASHCISRPLCRSNRMNAPSYAAERVQLCVATTAFSTKRSSERRIHAVTWQPPSTPRNGCAARSTGSGRLDRRRACVPRGDRFSSRTVPHD